jgi:hypothetical protein
MVMMGEMELLQTDHEDIVEKETIVGKDVPLPDTDLGILTLGLKRMWKWNLPMWERPWRTPTGTGE